MNILDKITAKTKERIVFLDGEKLKNKAYSCDKGNFPFYDAIKKDGISIIAEIKHASPSKGIITDDFDVRKISQEYKLAQVDCISVLTEPYFFMGDNSYVEIAKHEAKKPVLRKDFIIDEVQIYESKVIGADCILLISAILDMEKLKKFSYIAETIGLNCLVECHNEKEIELAIKSSAKIIGVNNRDLTTFDVDINNSLRLRKYVPSDILFVSESGIKTKKDMDKLKEIKTDGVLIGETFMRSNNKVNQIKLLKG